MLKSQLEAMPYKTNPTRLCQSKANGEESQLGNGNVFADLGTIVLAKPSSGISRFSHMIL